VICNGILKGSGEFTAKSPRNCEEIVGRNNCSLPCVPGSSSSIFVKSAGVFPSFRRLPTRCGVSPM
jgi:hypothetical protein